MVQNITEKQRNEFAIGFPYLLTNKLNRNDNRIRRK